MRISGSLFSVALFIVSGCGDADKPAAPPPPAVGVVKVTKQDVPLAVEASAKITGSLEIQIRAQVGGILKSRVFQEGQYVRQGEKLFEIDKEPCRAALTRAQGTLAQAQSELRRTSRDYERMKKLFRAGAVSQKDHDDSLSAYERADANMKVAEGSLHEAEINLGYTDVKAPISGIVRKEARSIGNLVSSSGESSLLTSMVQVCPLHVNFSIPGSMWSSMNKNYRDGRIQLTKSGEYGVEIIMPDGSIYPHRGRIIFIDSNEDSLTSAVSIKAEIPNEEKQQMLLPGQFVRVKLIGAEYRDVLVIPQSAFISTKTGSAVYALNDKNIVEVRPIKAESVGDKIIVHSGLKEGETVVAEGIIKARPGSPVTPVPISASKEKAQKPADKKS
ncbi:MAG: efflux RND transporter periplasmic adaptor subunit [Holosporaceae bacterium]|jgi:membrane fusion protein (multidrug efflux system)|nr:efflux RND transporter periplasmic adaptor subunit [Holosporaceae bacterium]